MGIAIKEISLYLLDRQTLSHKRNQPVIEQTMAEREYRTKMEDVRKILFKSPWGSFIEVQRPNSDEPNHYYGMNEHCMMERWSDKEDASKYYLEKII